MYPAHGSARPSAQSRLVHNGMICVVHNPRALDPGRDGEAVHGLPPSAPCQAFLVDDFGEIAPPDWNRSTREFSSYVVPVREEHGMWLDFRENAANTHDVAMVISSQGINCLTAQPTAGVGLEQYRKCCPLHNTPFANARRLCRECGYEWPAQNYISAVTGKIPWIDGFRRPDGKVHQFLITKNTEMGVATQLLGEARTSCVGIAFYCSVNPKPPPPPRRRNLENYSLSGTLGGGGYGGEKITAYNHPASATLGGMRGGPERASIPKAEISAGAQIIQDVGVDPNGIDHWEGKPCAMILFEFPVETDMEDIFAAFARANQPSGNPGGAFASVRKNNPFG